MFVMAQCVFPAGARVCGLCVRNSVLGHIGRAPPLFIIGRTPVFFSYFDFLDFICHRAILNSYYPSLWKGIEDVVDRDQRKENQISTTMDQPNQPPSNAPPNPVFPDPDPSLPMQPQLYGEEEDSAVSSYHKKKTAAEVVEKWVTDRKV